MLNKKNIFLRIYELKDKLCNLIKQKSKQKKKEKYCIERSFKLHYRKA